MHFTCICVGISAYMHEFSCRNYKKDSNGFSFLSKIILYKLIGMCNTRVMESERYFLSSFNMKSTFPYHLRIDFLNDTKH